MPARRTGGLTGRAGDHADTGACPTSVSKDRIDLAYYLDVADNIEGYWRLVDPIWKQIDIYRGADVFLATYGAAEKHAGLLFAAHFAQSEICNGGFNQLFWNSTGVLAPEAVEGFQAIGMTETAEILKKAMKLLGQNYPRERGERQNILAGLQKETFNELDEKFFVLIEAEHGGFTEAADRFASQILDLTNEHTSI